MQGSKKNGVRDLISNSVPREQRDAFAAKRNLRTPPKYWPWPDVLEAVAVFGLTVLPKGDASTNGE